MYPFHPNDHNPSGSAQALYPLTRFATPQPSTSPRDLDSAHSKSSSPTNRLVASSPSVVPIHRTAHCQPKMSRYVALLMAAASRSNRVYLLLHESSRWGSPPIDIYQRDMCACYTLLLICIQVQVVRRGSIVHFRWYRV